MADSVTASTARRLRRLFVGCTALVLLASPAFAGEQDSSSNASTQSASSASAPDFMLGRPRGSVGVRGSMLFASANSDIYDFVTDVLAIEKSDFNTGSFGAEFGVSISPRVDIIGAMDLNGMSHASDYRDWEDNRGLPIEQTTELKQMNFTGSVKFALLPRGRAVSRLAWIPNTFVPYVGAGAGYGKYEFRQNGDFVDFDNGNRVFSDTFRSEGWTPTYHVMGGTDIRVYRHLLLSFDARYSWQHATLGEDFIDFAPIDLGGFRFGAGVHFAF
jgi:opacity protein-like surface antigen